MLSNSKEEGVSNAQSADLGWSECLLELPVSLAQTVIWERAVKIFSPLLPD